MTQKEFNEIIQQCEHLNPSFLSRAIWRFQSSDEPDSIDIIASISVSIIGGICNTTSFFEKTTTKDDKESVINTVTALNDLLLKKMQSVEDCIY